MNDSPNLHVCAPFFNRECFLPVIEALGRLMYENKVVGPERRYTEDAVSQAAVSLISVSEAGPFPPEIKVVAFDDIPCFRSVKVDEPLLGITPGIMAKMLAEEAGFVADAASIIGRLKKPLGRWRVLPKWQAEGDFETMTITAYLRVRLAVASAPEGWE